MPAKMPACPVWLEVGGPKDLQNQNCSSSQISKDDKILLKKFQTSLSLIQRLALWG